MDPYTILILCGFLLLILLTLVAVRYTSTGLLATQKVGNKQPSITTQKQLRDHEAHRWLRLLLVSATSLAPLQAICMALHLSKIILYENSFPILAPTLGGVMTITLVRWRSFQDLGQDRRGSRSSLLAALLVVNGANLVLYPNLAVTILALSGFIAMLWALGLHFGHRFLSTASLVVVIWFALYTSGVLTSLIPPLTLTMSFVLYLLNTAAGTLAIVLPASLLYTLLVEERKQSALWLRLISGLVLLSIAIYTAYQGSSIAAMKPYLAAAEYYPFTQLLAATISGLLLAAQLDKHQRLYGPTFAILVSLLLISASILGWIFPVSSLALSIPMY